MALPSGYVEDILQTMEMATRKPLSSTGTSSGSGKEFELPDNWADKAELHKYRQVIGKLQWLVTARPDIAFSVKTLARETSGVTPDSWRKAKHLLRYLQGTKNLVFKIQPDVRLQSSEVDLDLHVFSDIDWAGDVATWKSTSGF